jgi:hypothetical protein
LVVAGSICVFVGYINGEWRISNMFWQDWDICHFKCLWTTELDNWFLIHIQDESGEGYIIRSDNGDLLSIEDSNREEHVIKKMIRAGIRVYSLEEWDYLKIYQQ